MALRSRTSIIMAPKPTFRARTRTHTHTLWPDLLGIQTVRTNHRDGKEVRTLFILRHTHRITSVTPNSTVHIFTFTSARTQNPTPSNCSKSNCCFNIGTCMPPHTHTHAHIHSYIYIFIYIHTYIEYNVYQHTQSRGSPERRDTWG